MCYNETGKALIPTDVALDLSTLNGVYARIAPRSGLAWRAHLHVGAGVVDADYRGSIGVDANMPHHGEMRKAAGKLAASCANRKARQSQARFT